MESIMVFVGVRDDGCVGYFESKDLPERWCLARELQRDISQIMADFSLSKKETLRKMNAHWQK